MEIEKLLLLEFLSEKQQLENKAIASLEADYEYLLAIEGYDDNPFKGKIWEVASNSPISSLRNILPTLTTLKTNKNLTGMLLQCNIWGAHKYELPVYYILNRDDWQMPSILAAEYFEKIVAKRSLLDRRCRAFDRY